MQKATWEKYCEEAIRVWNAADILKLVMKEEKYSICVCGLWLYLILKYEALF